MTVILRDQWFATGPDFTPHRADIAIAEGRIARIADAGTLDGPAIEGLDGTLALPGLVNAHTHGHANFARGLADRWTLEMSLVSGPWVSGPRDPEAIYLSTLLGALDMLSRGITSCYDLVLEGSGPTVEGIAAVAAAYRDAGMRAILCPLVADRTLFQAVPGLEAHVRAAVPGVAIGPAPETDALLKSLSDVLDRTGWVQGLLEPALSPTIATHCTPGLMTGARDLARAQGARLHMHVAEARFQARAARDLFGRPLVHELDRLGLIDARFTAAHAVWLEPDEQSILSDRGAQMVHLPLSNARLGVGTAPIAVARDRGSPSASPPTAPIPPTRSTSCRSRGRRRWPPAASAPARSAGSRAPMRSTSRPAARPPAWAGSAMSAASPRAWPRTSVSSPSRRYPERRGTTPSSKTLNGRVDVAATMVAGEIVVAGGRHRRFDAAGLAPQVERAFTRWLGETAALRAAADAVTPAVVDYVQSYGAGHAGGARFIPEAPV